MSSLPLHQDRVQLRPSLMGADTVSTFHRGLVLYLFIALGYVFASHYIVLGFIRGVLNVTGNSHSQVCF